MLKVFTRCVLYCSAIYMFGADDVAPKDCTPGHDTNRCVDVLLIQCIENNEKVQEQCQALPKFTKNANAQQVRTLDDCPDRKYKLVMKPKTVSDEGKVTQYINLIGAYYRRCMNHGKAADEEVKCEEHWPNAVKQDDALTGACESVDTADLKGLKIDDTDLDPGEAIAMVRAMQRETGLSIPPVDTGLKNWADFVIKHAQKIEGDSRRQVVAAEGVSRTQMTYAIVAEDWLLQLVQAQKDIFLLDCQNAKEKKTNENAPLVEAVAKGIWGEEPEKCVYSKPTLCEAPETGSLAMIIVIICVLVCLVGAFVFYAFFHHSWRNYGGSVRKTHGGTHDPRKKNEVEMSSSPMLNKF